MSQALTVIDNKNIRGVVAPAATLSQELLEDVIDLIELSTKKEARKTAARLKNGDRARAWIPLSRVSRKKG